MAELIDITKMGPQTYSQLQEQNDLSKIPVVEGMEELYSGPSAYGAEYVSGMETPVSVGLENWGESRYDENYATGDEVNHLGDIRAKNQPWITKLGAGIGKGAVLAGTTFVDGTVGLMYGIGTAVAEQRFSGLWDNDVSNAMAMINKASEEWMPNYYTEEENNTPWYRRLGTMNFWADSFLKNMGFTIGAFYSGKVWAAPLAALKLSAVAGEITGSALSAINEGRIEANNNVGDFKELNTLKIEDAFEKQKQEILSGIGPENLDINPFYYQNKALAENKIQELEARKNSLLADLDNRADSMGMGILLANTILLSANNFKTFGKLYSQGFKRSVKDFADTEKRLLSKRVLTEEGKYVFKDFTAKEGAIEGLKIGARESNEEMVQTFISETFGNYNSPDSPDAYYEALINPDAQIQTSDFLTAATQGFVNTYGNAERWEEGFVGALTGLLGMPTFGKMNNTSANTYIGRNKWLGLSGGIFGEMSINKERNAIGKSAVEVMNKYADKVQRQKDYFVQSTAFTDAMDRWTAENNAFEYKNSEDNDDFTAIASYARMGHLQNLKDLVNKDFENMSDEDLQRIALYTSKSESDVENPIGGWRNTDGTYMSETEDGRTTMRKELSKKRDKILKNIEDYENSVQIVRSMVGESPKADESQIEELAWLHWKLNRFNDRFAELKNENESLFNDYIAGINEYKRALSEEIESQQKDLSDDPSRALDPAYQESVRVLNSLDQRIQFIQQLKTMKSPLALATAMEDSNFKEFVKDLFGEQSFNLFETLAKGHLNYSQADKLFNDIQDLTKMATAAEQFNSRYKEYVNNPLSILENRKKQEAKVKKTADVRAAEDLVDKMDEDFDSVVDNSNIQDLIDTLENGQDLNHDYAEEIEKLEQLKALKELKTRISNVTNSIDGIDNQIKKDVTTLLNKVSSEKDLFNFDSELYNDPNNLFDDGDPTLANKSNDEIIFILGERLAAAKAYINKAKEIISKENAAMDNITEDAMAQAEAEETKTSGQDETAVVDAAINEVESGEKEFNISNEVKNIAEILGLDLNNNVVMASLQNIFDIIKEGLNKGLSFNEIQSNIMKVASYEVVQKENPNIDSYILQYYMDYNKEAQKENPLNPTEATPRIEADIKAENDKSLIGQSSNTSKQYWAPIQSRLPIHISEQSTEPLTPYYKLVGTPGYQNYSEAQIKYIKAVGEYLEEKGAWKRIDSGLVQNNEEIHFTTDTTLNEKAGTFVILITDKEGNVLGNLPVEDLDPTFGTYTGLKEFSDYLKSEYETKSTMPNVTSHLNKWMIGKVMYSMPGIYSTVQEIFTTTDSQGNSTQLPITFGIGAVTRSGQVRVVIDSNKRQDTAPDEKILQPLSVRNGQPYVLIETKNPTTRSKFVSVPVMMKTITTENNSVNNAIKEVLSRIFTLTPASTSRDIAKIKQSLEELVGGKFFITVDTAQTKLSIKNKENKWETIVIDTSRDTQNIPNIINDIMHYFVDNGIRYQMSLKYINKKYNGNDYNSMISSVVDTDILPGQTSTVSNWFTINPIQKNKEGNFEEVKALSPKSTRQSKPDIPGPANTSLFNFYYGDQKLAIDISNWNSILYQKDGKTAIAYVYDPTTGKLNINAATMAAYAYGLNKQVKISEPYKTPWGLYDANKRQFIQEPKQEETNENSESKEETSEDLERKAKDSGILQNALYKKIWNKLSDNLKKMIFEGNSAKEQMEILAQSYSAKDKSFKKSEEELLKDLTPKYRKNEDSEPYIKWDKNAEMKWLEKALPQFTTEDRLQLINSIIKITNANRPEYAWGQFKNGVITIYKGAAQGTLYHEAFHAVTQTLLTNAELNSLYEAAKAKYGDKAKLVLIEALAEDFRRYIQYEEDPNTNALTILFRKLKHFIQSLFEKDRYIDSMFYRISRSKFADRQVRQGNITLNATNVEYEKRLQEILDKAPRNKEGHLLAPNGKPTNLTEKQYAQVRTKEFKDWFGDWENDPENASKVIDENGEPLVVYHGNRTDNSITIFNKEKIGSEHKKLIEGFWFITDENLAKKEYALKPESIGEGKENFKYGEVLSVFLNIKNPVIETQKGLDIVDSPYGPMTIVKEKFIDFINRIQIDTENNDGFILNLQDSDSSADPFYVSKQTQLIVKNSNQIKSAIDNLGTFRQDSDNIYYRKVDVDIEIADRQRDIDYAKDEISRIKGGKSNIKSKMWEKWRFAIANSGFQHKHGDYDYQAQRFIDNNGLSDVAVLLRRPFQGRYLEGYIKAITREELKNRIQIAKDNSIKKLYGIIRRLQEEISYLKTNKSTIVSQNALEEQENKEIEDFHNEVYTYENLSSENKQLLEKKGISENRFNTMTIEEKEHLFYCG